MRLRDIMVQDVATILGEESIARGAERMTEADVGCLVVTSNGGVVGIITDRDKVVKCISQGHNSLLCPVSDHMTSSPILVEPDMDILDTAHLMKTRGVKRLPVVEQGKLVGIVSYTDIAKAMIGPMTDLFSGVASPGGQGHQ